MHKHVFDRIKKVTPVDNEEGMAISIGFFDLSVCECGLEEWRYDKRKKDLKKKG